MTLDATRVRLKEEDNILPWVLLFMECELDTRKRSDKPKPDEESGGGSPKRNPVFSRGGGRGGGGLLDLN